MQGINYFNNQDRNEENGKQKHGAIRFVSKISRWIQSILLAASRLKIRITALMQLPEEINSLVIFNFFFCVPSLFRIWSIMAHPKAFLVNLSNVSVFAVASFPWFVLYSQNKTPVASISPSDLQYTLWVSNSPSPLFSLCD